MTRFARLRPNRRREAELIAALARYAIARRNRCAANFPKIPRRVSGYNLDELLPEREFNLGRALVGSEGTCAVTLRATVRLFPRPKSVALAVIGFEDVYLAGRPDAVDSGASARKRWKASTITCPTSGAEGAARRRDLLPEDAPSWSSELGGDTAMKRASARRGSQRRRAARARMLRRRGPD